MRAASLTLLLLCGCATERGVRPGEPVAESHDAGFAAYRELAVVRAWPRDAAADATPDAPSCDGPWPIDEDVKPCDGAVIACLETTGDPSCFDRNRTPDVCMACIEARAERCRVAAVCEPEWRALRCCAVASCPGGQPCGVCGNELTALEECRQFARDEGTCSSRDEELEFARACSP